MKILIATDAWHLQVNGVVRTLVMMAEAAKGLGVEIDFLTPGSFRTFALPSGVDAGRIDASYDAGILTIRLHKSEQARPREIQIAVGAR